MINRLLILSASAGAGHLRAAEALEKAAREVTLSSEIRNIDTLQFTNKIFRHLYSKAYIDMVNKAPGLLGWLYDRLDTPWSNDKIRLAFDKFNSAPFIKMLKEYSPDLVLCTHFLPSEIISSLKEKGECSCRLGIIVTDFDVHAMWLCKNYDYYFVALDETKYHLAALGIPAEKIFVTGIPVDPIFATNKDKAEMRALHGLERDRITILISAGGFGVGPVDKLIQALLKLEHPSQVVALCGKSRELFEKISALKDNDTIKIKPLGYTDKMDELMSASDLIIGKPGGLTTSEALAKGLIMVIVNPIPGQEERNSDHLLEKGMAIRCNNLPTLAFKIDSLLNDQSKMADMKKAIKTNAKPYAALEICEIVGRSSTL